MTTKHTKGEWLYKISTPKEESNKYGGGNCGANAYIYAETGEKLFNRPLTKVIAYLPHWRDESQNEQHIANIMLMASSPILLNALIEINKMCADANSENPINVGRIAKISIEAINKAIVK